MSDLVEQMKMDMVLLSYSPKTIQSYTYHVGLFLKTLHKPAMFEYFINDLASDKWINYCKRPFGGPERALKYFGRYTHRVAISNYRIQSVDERTITFSYKDYQDGDRRKQMALSAEEFIRRFLLNVLPHGYYRIRYYGLFSNRNREKNLERCRQLLKAAKRETKPFDLLDALFELTGLDLSRCPNCQSGEMRIVKHLEPVYQPP